MAASSSRLEARGMQGRAVKGEAGDTARNPSGKAGRNSFHMTYIVLCYRNKSEDERFLLL